MALEKTLRTSVRTVLMSTFRACLTGMSWVNFDYFNTFPCGFVGHEAVQLCKRPTMEATFGLDILLVLATSDGGCDANVFQVLKDKGTSLRGVVYNPFGEDMVMVFSLPKPFARKLFQVPCSRFGTTLLELAPDAKHLAFLLLPTLFTKKETLRSHGGSGQSEVNPNHGLIWRNVRFRDRDNHMQRKASLAVTQISTTRFIPNVLRQVSRNREVKLNTSVGCGKTTSVQVPLDPIGTLVIADRGYHTLRTVYRSEVWNRASLFVCL